MRFIFVKGPPKTHRRNVIVSLLFIVKCKGYYRPGIIGFSCLQPIGITNVESHLPIHDLITPITIILLIIKLNKMFLFCNSKFLFKICLPSYKYNY